MQNIKQTAIQRLPELLALVKQSGFVASKNATNQQKRRTKQYLLRAIEQWLQNVYPFSHYQAEFVVNQAIKTSHGQPENRLVMSDRRLAIKVARQTVMLANHYYNFIAGPEG